MFARIIIPLDGSENAEKALDYGIEIARKFQAGVTLVRSYQGEEQSARMLATMSAEPGGVVDPTTVQVMTDAAKEGQDEAHTYINAQVQKLQGLGLTADGVIVDQTPSAAILAAAGAATDPLVVMCSHGRGGLERLILGSTAQDVLSKAQTPVLLIRVYGDDLNGDGGQHGMDISIGADVMGTGGKLGEVHRVIVDARTDRVTDMIVKHGFLFGRERIVNLEHITKVENGVIFVDLDERGFEIMDGFTDDRFRAPDPNYSGPPGFNNEDFLMDTIVAEGSAAGLGQTLPPMGFPGGEQVSPDDLARPAVSPGTDVLDVNGDKIGEVHEFAVAQDSGSPTRLVVRSGFIFKHDAEIPVAWVKEVSDTGVMLNVSKDQVEALGEKK